MPKTPKRTSANERNRLERFVNEKLRTNSGFRRVAAKYIAKLMAEEGYVFTRAAAAVEAAAASSPALAVHGESKASAPSRAKKGAAQ